MALKLWLPLNEDLHNQGISNVTTINVPSGVAIDSTGKIGKCYTSSGSAVGVTTDFNFEASQFSIAAWVRINTRVNSWRCPFKLANNSAADKYQYIGFCCEHNTQATSVGFHFFKTIDGTNTSIFDAYPITDMTVGQWAHLAVTYNGKVVTYYKNGTKVFSNTIAAAKQNTVADIDRIIMFGGDGSRGSAAVKSSLNDVRIYDNCLSATEVREIAQGLVLHYKLDGYMGGVNDNLFYNANFNDGLSHWGGVNNSQCSIVQKNDINTITATKGTTNNLVCQTSKCYHTASTTETLTFSCDIYSELEGTFQGNVWIANNGWKSLGSFTWNTTNIQIGWNHIYGTVNTSSSVSASGYIIISVGFSNTTYYMAHPKLEYGNKATAWTLNSEELGIDSANIEDSSGYNHNGTIVGSAIPAADTARYNVSTHIDGAGVITAATPGADIRTLSCWVKTTKNKSTSQMLVADSASNMCISFYAGTIIGVFGTTRSTGSKCTLGASYKENDWNHIVVVKTSDDGQRDIYCNGEKLTPAADDYWSATAGFFVGNRNGTVSGNTPFYGYISDVRAYCTPLLDTDIKQLYNVGMKVDKLGNIHPYELQENNDMMVNAKFINNSATSVSYDEATDTYTIVSPVGTSSWGYGVRLADAPALMVPYGATYRWTAEVWTPVALNINTDYNNTAGGTDINWAGNDNDATGTRLTAGVAIPANKWTRIYRGASNTNNGNTNHLPIRDYSSLGLVTNGQSNSVTWKVRHLQWYIADTGFKPQIKRTGIFEASHFTEVEEDLNKPAQLHKKMLSVNATQFIER